MLLILRTDKALEPSPRTAITESPDRMIERKIRRCSNRKTKRRRREGGRVGYNKKIRCDTAAEGKSVTTTLAAGDSKYHIATW